MGRNPEAGPVVIYGSIVELPVPSFIVGVPPAKEQIIYRYQFFSNGSFEFRRGQSAVDWDSGRFKLDGDTVLLEGSRGSPNGTLSNGGRSLKIDGYEFPLQGSTTLAQLQIDGGGMRLRAARPQAPAEPIAGRLIGRYGTVNAGGYMLSFERANQGLKTFQVSPLQVTNTTGGVYVISRLKPGHWHGLQDRQGMTLPIAIQLTDDNTLEYQINVALPKLSLLKAEPGY